MLNGKKINSWFEMLKLCLDSVKSFLTPAAGSGLIHCWMWLWGSCQHPAHFIFSQCVFDIDVDFNGENSSWWQPSRVGGVKEEGWGGFRAGSFWSRFSLHLNLPPPPPPAPKVNWHPWSWSETSEDQTSSSSCSQPLMNSTQHVNETWSYCKAMLAVSLYFQSLC